MTALTCTSCGTSSEPHARYCGACGTKLQAIEEAWSAAPTEASLALPGEGKTLPPAPAAASPDSAPKKSGKKVQTAENPVTLIEGRVLNHRYLVESKLGEGGFGSVFRGRQLATGRQVALKVLHSHNLRDSTVVARFRREAEASSRLRNPHTVILYDFDEAEDGTLYLAMELCPGRSLQVLQKQEGPMSPARVLGILDQVAEALAEAHDHDIVHRDMKPENVMVETLEGKDSVKVLDFGIAKIVPRGSERMVPALTAVGQTVGTLEFMSPEQLRGQTLDGRSDIYALGMMAYEMLTGVLPFQAAKTSTEVIRFHLHQNAPAPSSLKPELAIPAAVDAVVLKMVAKKPSDRHTDAPALRRHIRQALGSLNSRASRRRNLRMVVWASGFALAAATAAALITF